ncbi:MFS transporter [Nonomuraea sp. NBC_01738]|uniref:MFS transporter n=1 Tax=Nonomuraea sp. NBC_01738 TaxID=2976003 RepID=UPI002E0F1D37|nr:MFS transporter [Nonomuraea sp. NBC_01738]
MYDTSAPVDLHPKRWAALIMILIAVFMDLVDTTVVLVALPSLQKDLGASEAVLEWTAAGYTLAFATLLITGGRLGDRFGRKRVFLGGLVLFLVASVAAGLSVNPAMLVGSRLVQGGAAALMIPQVLPFIQTEFSEQERPKAIGVYGMTFAVGGVSGPLLGGLLLNADLFGWGWRSIFFINVPFGLVCLLGVAMLARESRTVAETKFDVLGLLIATAALVALFYPLIEGQQLGWPAWIIALPVLALVLFALFVARERAAIRRGADPLIDPALFGSRAVSGGLAVAVVFFCAPAYGFVMTLFLQDAAGWTALHTALTLLAFAVGVVFGSGVAVQLAPKLGRKVVIAGPLVMAAGIAWITVAIQTAGTGVGTWQLVPGLFIAGLGMSAVATTLITVVLAQVPYTMAGAASGVINTTIQIGTALGIAVIGTVFFTLIGSSTATNAATVSLTCVAGLLVVAAALGFLLPPQRAMAEQQSTGQSI